MLKGAFCTPGTPSLARERQTMLPIMVMCIEGKVHLSPGSNMEEHNPLGWGEDSGKDGTWDLKKK